MRHVTLEEARDHLEDLIEAAARGEEVFITRDAGQVVQLVPRPKPEQQRRFGSARGLFTLAEDFDGPLPDFSDYKE